MAEKSTGRESDKFMLRLPDGMRERIGDAAKQANRTMNAEIVRRLEWSFELAINDVLDDMRQARDKQSAVEKAHLEFRLVQERADTAMAHYRVAEMHMDRLLDKVDSLQAAGGPKEDIERCKEELDKVQHDRLRLWAIVDAMTDESSRTERQYHEALKAAGGPVEKTVERALQAEYLELHAREEAMGIPEAEREVKMNTPRKRAPKAK